MSVLFQIKIQNQASRSQVDASFFIKAIIDRVGAPTLKETLVDGREYCKHKDGWKSSEAICMFNSLLNAHKDFSRGKIIGDGLCYNFRKR